MSVYLYVSIHDYTDIDNHIYTKYSTIKNFGLSVVKSTSLSTVASALRSQELYFPESFVLCCFRLEFANERH